MLVLSRRVGEQICIGEEVVLTVVAVQRGKVRLGVQAPPEVEVDRREVRCRKKVRGCLMDPEEIMPLLVGRG